VNLDRQLSGALHQPARWLRHSGCAGIRGKLLRH
jgi:hypothetical protein